MSGTTHFGGQLGDGAGGLIPREGDAHLVSIEPLLYELSQRFGDQFPLSDIVYQVLELIHMLADDPHVDLVTYDGYIEFAWNERGRDALLEEQRLDWLRT